MNNLIRFSPRTNLFGLQREIDDLFEHFVPANRTTGAWAPSVDLTETETGFVLTLDVPGIPKEDLNLAVKDNVLTISGERKAVAEGDGTKRWRSERRFGTFERRFTLSQQVNTEGIEADYTNGVLTVTLPKVAEVAPREIAIN
ncbi:MAG: Hsp20/alpha crystallin family protein [Rhodothermales bacterium]